HAPRARRDLQHARHGGHHHSRQSRRGRADPPGGPGHGEGGAEGRAGGREEVRAGGVAVTQAFSAGAARRARRRAFSHSMVPAEIDRSTTARITSSMFLTRPGNAVPRKNPSSVIDSTHAAPPITLNDANRR